MLDVIIMRLKAWSLLVLPTIGFIIGQVLQLALCTKNNRPFEGLIIHLITVILIVIVSSDVISTTEHAVQIQTEQTGDTQEKHPPMVISGPRDKLLLLIISYLFILGVILGIISVLF